MVALNIRVGIRNGCYSSWWGTKEGDIVFAKVYFFGNGKSIVYEKGIGFIDSEPDTWNMNPVL